MLTEDMLKKIDEKLGAILSLLADHVGVEKPQFVQKGEQVVAEVPAPAPETTEELNADEQTLEVGARVRYVGNREMPSSEATVVEVKERGWIVVMFDGEASPKNVRLTEISTEVIEQPPELTEEEEAAVDALDEEEDTPVYPGNSGGLDEEAAGYKMPSGMYASYRDLHAIYSDTKKADTNRKYLRFRATKVMGGDETTKEMCHRYLVSIGDEEYVNGVSA